MLWPGAVLAFVFIFASTQITEITSEDGYIGCLFSKTLCEDDEWCYDDFVFGRCLPSTSADVDDLYRYDLDKDTIRQFSRELERLFYLGYRWSHDYTQCRLQTMLHSIRNDLTFENNACSYLVDQDLAGALKALEVENLPEPQEMAIVKYTPSADNPHADFADEVYFPPSDGGGFQNRIVAPNDRDVYELEAPFSESEIKKHKRGFGSRGSLNVADYDSTGNVPLETELSRYFAEKNNDLFFKNYIFPQKGLNGMEKISSGLKENFYPENGNFDAYNEIPMVFSMSYNTPDNFRAGWESKDLNQALMNEFPESRVYFDDNEQEVQQPVEYGSGIETPGDANFDHYGYDTPDNGKLLKAYETLLRDAASQKPILDDVKSRLFTEGGVIYPNRHYESVAGNEAPGMLDLLKGFNVGFQRPERLDVKKAGPTYDKKAIEEEDKQIKSFNENEILPKIMKKEPRGAHPNPFYHDIYDIETDFVYVVFENRIHTWNEGIFLIRNITAMIKLPRGVVSHERVGHNEVTFKIGPNSGMNATEVVEKIDKLQNAINRETGFRIIAAGVGDTIKRQSVIKAPLLLSSTMLSDDAWFVGIIACGLLASSVIAIGTLVIIKKCINSRDKLSGLPHRDNEASKDYQDLCRARMATKCQISNETVHGRIASLSKESEQSPPSRSSTSSWSEEPALHNMDISTGHMVLSYMEDHLRNKDRLDQEWIALCAYVAEPSETKAAKKKENVDKNRYADIVPYDHSRVVLNELSNANGSDYINASSITDHDPRNPTYIATQGPLPHTASDFWQLIWEQGAVVIVMLTRLTEGGSAMCHRYWPEEGSDLYHIYEIHLVSEHIWCDDYLVRSFYLKNTRTGETRTVTQFHFLSWPEGSIPGSTKTLLEFRRKVNKSYRGRSCPIVVHCSDGAGRTGTYCLIDMVLSRMAKGAKEIDIAATLEHLRDQRPKMVATKQQFEFVLTAVAEEVHAILKALPPQPSTGLNQEKEK